MAARRLIKKHWKLIEFHRRWINWTECKIVYGNVNESHERKNKNENAEINNAAQWKSERTSEFEENWTDGIDSRVSRHSKSKLDIKTIAYWIWIWLTHMYKLTKPLTHWLAYVNRKWNELVYRAPEVVPTLHTMQCQTFTSTSHIAFRLLVYFIVHSFASNICALFFWFAKHFAMLPPLLL